MRRGLLLACVALVVGIASAVWAHGPTMRVSYTRIQPPALSIHVGDTVHFVNMNSGGGAVTLVGEGGAFESPTFAPRGDGWHHTFTEAGTYAFTIREYAGTTGRVIVSKPPESR